MIAGWWQRRAEQREIRRAADLHQEGVQLLRKRQPEEAERAFKEAVRLRAERLGPEAALTLESEISLAEALRQLGFQGEAVDKLREVVSRSRAALGEGHDTTCLAEIRLANHLIVTGRPAEAEEQALAVLAVRHGRDDFRLRAADVRLRAVSAQGRHREAADGALPLTEDYAAMHGKHGLLTLKVRSDRVQDLIFLGEYAQAESECRTVMGILPTGNLFWLAVNNALVLALVGMKRYEEAEATARAALKHAHKGIPALSSVRLVLQLGLARVLAACGQNMEALQITEDAKTEFLADPRSWATLQAALGIVTATALLGLGRFEEAESEVRRALANALSTYSAVHYTALEAGTLLGTVLAACGQRTEAQHQLESCVSGWHKHFGPDHSMTVAATAKLDMLR
ncbi:tetratricopeptide repeat protein [Kitasatospora sp. GP82]|uniref:tetratricopeptide repeat protein n=1 Tax=Kitasatospora sp. GP82 TaxID=3035089 RepID=UPI002473E2A0|nr:tetratricopeptide repeat protein [Kitasatospora sp. GP82]MDH6129272.1 tetratricopeptide (TPR) repeat protein [Kitasatospora sp. GP82]